MATNASGAENVGGIFYNVTLETGDMVTGQRKVQAELDKTSSSLASMTPRLTMAASAVAVFVVALGAAAIKSAKAADEMRLLSARVQVAAGSFDAGASAMASLVDVSRRTGTSVEANIDVFTRLNQSILRMGGTQEDTLKITELLGKAIKVSGASATEAKAAMLQFGQAMGSGKLQGDELHSLMETAPYLMKKLADGIGVPVGALKSMGEQGKLTSSVVANALSKAATSIDADFQKFPQTIAGAMDVAVDAAGRVNSKMDDLLGTSAALTGVTKGVGDVFDEFAKQLGTTSDEATNVGRNKSITSWAEATKYALSYVVDALDIAWTNISFFGRNIAYVFTGVGAEIGGIGAQIAAVMRGDFAGAMAIGDAMKADADTRRAAVDAANDKALSKAKYAGQQMREAWDTKSPDTGPSGPMSPLKPDTDPEEVKKLALKRLAAQEYYDSLVAGNKAALDKINAEEQKALTENLKRRTADSGNADIYNRARLEIVKKFARERAALEEKTAQETADLNIALSTNEAEKIELVRAEAFRRADANEKLGVQTHLQAEQAKTLATFTAEQARLDLAERNERARADARITLSTSQEQKILFVRDEAMRQAEESYKRGKITFEEQEAAKVKAAFDAKQQLIALQAQHAATQIDTLGMRASTSGGVDDQVALIQAQAQAALDANAAAAELDLAAAQLYADQKVAIETKMHQDIQAARDAANQAALGSASSIAESLMSITKNTSGEQSDAYKVAFAAQKAFAIASAIVNIQTALSSASMSLPFPGNLGAMATVAAATAGIVATISSTSISGRQYGGPVSGGSLYRVNETGAPEMYTASNGSQYMLPTSGGSVTSADKIGSGPAPTIIIQNLGNPQQVQSASYDQQTNTVKMAVAEISKQFSENSGPAWASLRNSSNVAGRM